MKKRSGQFLVELLVALGILTTGFMAMLGLLSRSIGLSRVVSDDYVATYLASEGIEVAKNILDANTLQEGRAWNAGFASAGVYEVSYDSRELSVPDSGKTLNFDEAQHYSYYAGTPTPFRRKVVVTPVEDVNGKIDEIQINSIIDWSSRGRTAQVNLEAHFFNWQSR